MNEATHSPMPVTGYTEQSDANVQIANQLKAKTAELGAFLLELPEIMTMDKEAIKDLEQAKVALKTLEMFGVSAIFKPQTPFGRKR